MPGRRRRASRSFVRRADHEHLWVVSVHEADNFNSPETVALSLLIHEQWRRAETAAVERATLLRTVCVVNSMVFFQDLDNGSQPPDIGYGLYLTDAEDTTPDDPNLADFYNEDVLRFGIANHAVRFATANTANINNTFASIEIDSKVKRKLTNKSNLRLALSFETAHTIPNFQTQSVGSYRAITRCLLKLG